MNPGGRHSQINLKKADGENIESDEVSTFVNNYFATIGQSLYDQKGNDANTPRVKIKDIPLTDDGIEINIDELVTLDKVVHLISKISKDKSSGIDEVNSTVLKDTLTLLPEHLVSMYKNSLRQSLFPKAWTIGNLVPIPKKGDLTQIKNWRPITLLPLPGKLLEKIVHEYLSQHLERHQLLSNSQYGFRPGMSTSDAVFSVLHDLYEHRDDNEYTVACFVDYK